MMKFSLAGIVVALWASSSQAFTPLSLSLYQHQHQNSFQSRTTIALQGAYEDFYEPSQQEQQSSTTAASSMTTDTGAPEPKKNEEASGGEVEGSSTQFQSSSSLSPSDPPSLADPEAITIETTTTTTTTTTSKSADDAPSPITENEAPPAPSTNAASTTDPDTAGDPVGTPLVRNSVDDPSFPSEKKESPTAVLDTVGMTERIMKRVATENQASGAGGGSSWEAFQRTEENWTKLKASKPFNPLAKGAPPLTPFVTQDAALGSPACWTKLREQRLSKPELDYDVVVCGGTLGIFFAFSLQLKGHRVCVMEAGKLRGREQEWNISMEELEELVKLGVLTQDDIDAAVTTEFPACRSGFKNKEVTPLEGGYYDNNIGYECVTADVLNLGVSPGVLLERVAKRFQEQGGVIRDETRLVGVTVSESVGAAVDLGENEEPVTAKLVIDCMGNASPISRQQRYGLKPDGVCAVVGSCAGGYDAETNLQGDIIYTMDPIEDKGKNGKLQYFWEAFPVGIGRNGMAPGTSDVKTTYMFTYMDAHENRPKLESLMEDYWRLLPKYQNSISNPETDLDVKRVLFAYFPTYTDSPLKPMWSRVLPVGDASGIQSPLSFGGFGALTRHLDRISTAVDEAIVNDLLHKDYLGEINAYTPNLSAAWMFQKAMSVKMGQQVDEKFVNRLLAVNFDVMDKMGKRTIKPFLQDVVRFDGLVGSLARSFVADPTFMPQIVAHVGIPRLVDWLGHLSMIGLYDVLDNFATPIISPFVDRIEDPAEKYLWRRRIDAWKFGSGNDYTLPEDN